MTYPADDERRWSDYMAAAHRGDKRLYERLLTELAPVIERYIRSRFGALTFTEDCVQECLLAIHNARHTYDPARPFRPWFFTIVRNRTIDLLRKSWSHHAAAGGESGAIDAAAVTGPQEDIEAARILEQLKPQFRSALTLTKLFGYSLTEAAEKSGISASAMKSRVSRALKAAEQLLNEERDMG
jgi:RNA polymerase sigma-70 factor, ECF subfamily